MGGFLLSIDDATEIREIFVWSWIEEVKTSYFIGRKAESRGGRGELLIRGGNL